MTWLLLGLVYALFTLTTVWVLYRETKKPHPSEWRYVAIRVPDVIGGPVTIPNQNYV